ncbi:MAG: LLM class F420-dependent oxidoreductase [Acidimicrobiia bacterium]
MIGLLCFFTEDSMPVAEAAGLVEERGVESLWAPEHTHIPAARATDPPLGGELPRQYSRLFDPFLVLTTAAAVTTRLRLGTGVALVANHHPITLAKQIATLDQLSGGRFLFGIGAGWNQEEIENHGVEHATRWRRALEHLAAMKAIWAGEEASFSGEWVTFDRIWSWPKPLQRPHPPVLVGTINPTALVVRHADGWLPLSLAHPGQLAERIAVLGARATEAGRDPDSIEITVFCLERTPPDQVAAYLEMGVSRVVLRAPVDSATRLEGFLDPYAPLLDRRIPVPAKESPCLA